MERTILGLKAPFGPPSIWPIVQKCKGYLANMANSAKNAVTCTCNAVIMMPNTGWKHEISLKMAQTAVILHLYNVGNIDSFLVWKSLKQDQCDTMQICRWSLTLNLLVVD